MYLYSAIMLSAAAAMLWVAAKIYRGNIALIMSHHTEKVNDAESYCKAMGISLYIMGTGIGLSGIISLLGEARLWFILSAAALAAGILFGLIGIIISQKKYNGGIF